MEFENSVGFLPAGLLLGVPEIDSQHERIFAELASLKAHCLETNELSFDHVKSLLSNLRDHFATEERLALAASLCFSEHARKHHEVLWNLTKAFSEIREGRGEVFGVLRYLDYWFERHISEFDRQVFFPVIEQAGLKNAAQPGIRSAAAVS